MPEKPEPATLRALAAALPAAVAPEAIGDLLAHAEAWEAEQLALTRLLDSERERGVVLTEQLSVLHKRVDVLEQDRKWWQENAIRRMKRTASRRSARPPDSEKKP